MDATALFAAIIGKDKVNDLLMLKERVEIFPMYEFPEDIQSKAEKLAPHSKDSPYFALALYLNCGIWSRERDFKKQDEIKVFNTKDLINNLEVKK